VETLAGFGRRRPARLVRLPVVGGAERVVPVGLAGAGSTLLGPEGTTRSAVPAVARGAGWLLFQPGMTFMADLPLVRCTVSWVGLWVGRWLRIAQWTRASLFSVVMLCG
jgi:hypothetical protein